MKIQRNLIKQYWLKVVLFGLVTVFCIHAQMAFAQSTAAIAWQDDINSPFQVDLSGTGSVCPNGCTYSWSFGATAPVTATVVWGSASGSEVNVEYSTGGTYTVTLTVTDKVNHSDTATTTASVTARDTATASIEWKVDSSVSNQVDFNAAGSYCKNGCNYSWNFNPSSNPLPSGVTATPSSASTETVSVLYNKPGTYYVQLTVADIINAADTATVTTKVATETLYKKPTAKNSNITICDASTNTTTYPACADPNSHGLTVTLTDNSDTNPAGGICMATVTWGDGASTTQACGTAAGSTHFTHSYWSGGKYEVMETAEDMTSTLSASATPVVIYPWDPNTVPASTPPCPGSVDGYYCGQSTLYQNTSFLYYCHNGGYSLSEMCSVKCAAALGTCSGGTLTSPINNITQATCTSDGGTVWTPNSTIPDSCQ